jgi:large subunit ribosomal protein L16
MPLIPKRVKFRKTHRGSRAGNATRGTKVSFGEFGLQCLGRGWITNRQIESCRISINRHLKRKGKVWIRIFPHKPITARPPETRMGKGKGPVDAWVAVVRPGTMMFEIAGVPESAAKEALRLAANKLGVRCRFVNRAEQ